MDPFSVILPTLLMNFILIITFLLNGSLKDKEDSVYSASSCGMEWMVIKARTFGGGLGVETFSSLSDSKIEMSLVR
jgi:hypothetical protein